MRISPGFRGGSRSHIHQLYRFEKPVKFASVKRAAFEAGLLEQNPAMPG